MHRSFMRVGTLAVVALTPGFVCAQSLADAAKKEQARRKGVSQTTSVKKVYTESDLSGSGSTSAAAEPANTNPSGESKGGAVQPAVPGATGSSTGAPSQEDLATAWRARAVEARERVKAAEEHLRAMQTGPSGGVKIKTCLIPDSVVRQGEAAVKSFPCPDRWESQTDAARRLLQEARAALSAMEERARREGVPPSWLR